MIIRNTLIAIGLLALITGVMVSFFSIRHLSVDSGPAGAPQLHTAVLVATHLITTGSLLRTEDMIWKDVAAADIRPQDITNDHAAISDFVGSVSRADFREGDALVASALVKANDRSFLAAVLTPGFRAVTIAVDASQTASGLVLPGDHVDVILTQSFGDKAADLGRRSAGETILGDVRVVAVDQFLSGASKPSPAESRFGVQDERAPKTITLELTELDAQKLFVPTQLGKIELSVRGLEAPAASGAFALIPAATTWGDDVSPALRAIERSGREAPAPAPASAPAARAPPPPQEKMRSPIEVMHGSKIELR